MPKKRKISRRAATSEEKPSIWEALNEPIAYPSAQFGKNLFVLSLFLLTIAWVSPYWGSDSNDSDLHSNVANTVSYEYQPLFEEYTLVGQLAYDFSVMDEPSVVVMGTGGMVAGAFVSEGSGFEAAAADDGSGNILAAAFTSAAYEMFDLSGDIQPVLEFYQPGVDAAWNAWLELMKDPVFHE